jgi:hypothetical protein
MLPHPVYLARGSFSRLMMQIAASALLTAFYTPGGAAGWTLDLLLRSYFAVTRRFPLSLRARSLRVVAGGGAMIPTVIVEK